ncbi:hypothetical protein GTU73_08940 [Rathayibacter sp. VKM Ac-2804]|uniref:hypothetical protein n=1 Tax=Rathayibacter sp. VKM Ac-2804 TaxID=2609257 RepID=UPI00132EA363|nr:hypothetical protein [Rathayibacter sp. VKM Ac-2804]QHF24124.1 hypothetical protein GTU73_08940 [Rathayibacter sp. VKM Ac-2804]
MSAASRAALLRLTIVAALVLAAAAALVGKIAMSRWAFDGLSFLAAALVVAAFAVALAPRRVRS